jgi:HAD superfamily hydrolase (TIGR01490 family)
MNLALFDLDNTLIATDSDYEWGQFLIAKGVVERAQYEARNDAFFADYKAGTLDINAYLHFALEPLARHARAELDAWHAEFMQSVILPTIGPAARALVREHLDAGDLCCCVTATNAFVTAPIAREFGIPHLIAAEAEEIDGRFTGRPIGIPSFQEGKITRVEQWLGAMGKTMQSFAQSHFYSDSRNDIPLLERVSIPVAVDPDDTLRQTATARGWRIMTLR